MNNTPESGITVKKNNNFSEWYQQILTKGKLIEYYDVSGCYILLPNSYNIWENIMSYLDIQFKNKDVKNVYFPLFVTKNNLEKEANHISGFKAEVAWITKSGNSNLSEPIAIRPTSESIIYATLPNLIQSYSDLPLKFNQWCNVVRWEFKDPTPFIRSREFLWNEGHSSFVSREDAQKDAIDMIKLYKQTYFELLAVPTILGQKTEKEKFAGADSTYTIETFIPEVGKAVQAATSHMLGQNFSKMFNIQFQDENASKQYVWQTSWGFTTRSIGIMLMYHSDNLGAVIPPKVANIQIVIIPIIIKESESVIEYSTTIANKLKHKFRIHVDNRNYKPGWKYNYWERHGVPLRIEIGPKDVKNNVITICRRNDQVKKVIDINEKLENLIENELDIIHTELYNLAINKLHNCLTKPNTWSEFVNNINNKKMCSILWCGQEECEDVIKNETKAKSLCQPLEKYYQLQINEYSTCLKCDKKAIATCIFGKSY